MADDKSGAWGSSFVVLAFAAVSAVYVGWQQAPLVSFRPTEFEYRAHKLESAQDIDARLWEDPFAAVMRDIEAKHWRDPTAGGGHTTARFDHPGETTLVLGVTLPGASYPEVAQTRRRLRYAVLSALYVVGYAPADEKHIGYWRPNGDKSETKAPQTEVRVFQNDWPAATNLAASGNGLEPDFEAGIQIRVRFAEGKERNPAPTAQDPPLPEIVPWEEFDKDGKHVLVLWLDEDFLSQSAALSNCAGC
jgi:hypothetical protein